MAMKVPVRPTPALRKYCNKQQHYVTMMVVNNNKRPQTATTLNTYNRTDSHVCIAM